MYLHMCTLNHMHMHTFIHINDVAASIKPLKAKFILIPFQITRRHKQILLRFTY